MGAAYDSFCISEYGVDQYHSKMPVYFRCFDEGQDALYTYVSMYFLIKAVSENRATYYFLAGILWGLTLYTYAITYLVIPFFLIVVLFYLAYVNRIVGGGFPSCYIRMKLLLSFNC
jgi:hypothetical protein